MMNKLKKNIILLVLLLLTACQSLSVAHYDVTTDKLITQLQQQIDLVFVRIEHALLSSKSSYKQFTTQYQTIETDLDVLQTRVSAIPHNHITAQQVKILQHSIMLLQRRHHQGFHNLQEVQQLHRLLDSQFHSILTLELAKPK